MRKETLDIYFHHNQVGTSVYYWNSALRDWTMLDLFRFDYMDTSRAERDIVHALSRTHHVVVHQRDHLLAWNDPAFVLAPPSVVQPVAN